MLVKYFIHLRMLYRSNWEGSYGLLLANKLYSIFVTRQPEFRHTDFTLARVDEVYNLVTSVRKNFKLKRDVNEFMKKRITLHKKLKMAANYHQTHLNSTSHIVLRSSQNIVLS